MDVNNYDLNSLLQFLKETNEEEIKFKTKICTQKEEIVKTENVINQFQNCLNQQNEMLSRLSTDHDNVKHRKNKLMQAIMQLDNENEADSSYDSNVNSINVSVNQKVLSENEDKLQNFTFNNEKDLKRNIEGNNKKLTIPNIGETSENKKRKIEESNNCTKNISLNETKSGNETFIESLNVMTTNPKLSEKIFQTPDNYLLRLREIFKKYIILENRHVEDQKKINVLEEKLKRWEHSFTKGDEHKRAVQHNLFQEKTMGELTEENRHLRMMLWKEVSEQEKMRASLMAQNELIPIREVVNRALEMNRIDLKVGCIPQLENIDLAMKSKRKRPSQSKRRALRRQRERLRIKGIQIPDKEQARNPKTYSFSKNCCPVEDNKN